MKTKLLTAIFVAVIGIGLIPSSISAMPITPQKGGGTAEKNQADSTSAYGKYSSIIQILNCPADKATYGNYTDYGYWGGGAWCGQTGSAGYWVWVFPNWYVWKYQK